MTWQAAMFFIAAYARNTWAIAVFCLKMRNCSASPISDLLPPLLGEGGGGGSSGAVFAERRRHTDPHPHLPPKAGRRKAGSRGTAPQSDLSSYEDARLRTSMQLHCFKARRIQHRQHLGNVLTPACLNHQFNLDVLHRQHGERALVMHLVDVGAGVGHHRRDLRQ